MAVPSFAADHTLKDAPAQVSFSPNGGQDAIVKAIGEAISWILMQAYNSTPSR